MTLTIAATKAIYHFKRKSKFDNFKDLMTANYGFDIYNSKKAKTEYLKPNLLSFD